MYTRTEEKTNFVRIEMESGETITLELYPETAPITVENFKDLFHDGYPFLAAQSDAMADWILAMVRSLPKMCITV